MYAPPMASTSDLCRFHSEDYINFLSRVRVNNLDEYAKFFQQYNVMEDCPIFDGLFEFCKKYTGASLQAATMLNNNVNAWLCDIVYKNLIFYCLAMWCSN